MEQSNACGTSGDVGLDGYEVRLIRSGQETSPMAADLGTKLNTNLPKWQSGDSFPL
jgi:hypothetical protein